MEYGIINIWIRNDKCKPIDDDGIVTIETCDGKPFNWCNHDFGNVPFHCGHVSIKIPPGCYLITAKIKKINRHDNNQIKGDEIFQTNKTMVIASCKEEACVNLIVAGKEDRCRIHFIDTFSTDKLSSGWIWFDELVSDQYSLTKGWLKICANKGQDLWGGPTLKRGAPLMIRSPPSGDYWAETFVSACDCESCEECEKREKQNKSCLDAPSQPLNTQVGMFVFQDVKNWIFFGLTNHQLIGEVGDGLIVTKTEADSSSIVEKTSLAEDFAFLKIEKLGNNWKFYWKLHHDDSWNLLATTELSLSEHKVGMGAKTFDLDNKFGPVQAYFDYYLIGQCL